MTIRPIYLPPTRKRRNGVDGADFLAPASVSDVTSDTMTGSPSCRAPASTSAEVPSVSPTEIGTATGSPARSTHTRPREAASAALAARGRTVAAAAPP